MLKDHIEEQIREHDKRVIRGFINLLNNGICIQDEYRPGKFSKRRIYLANDGVDSDGVSYIGARNTISAETLISLYIGEGN